MLHHGWPTHAVPEEKKRDKNRARDTSNQNQKKVQARERSKALKSLLLMFLMSRRNVQSCHVVCPMTFCMRYS